MRVNRKEDVGTGNLEGSGTGTDAVKGARPTSFTDEIAPAKSGAFVDKLFSSVLGEISGTVEALQTRVDETSADLIEQPNQVTLDAYKESVSHLVAYLIDHSVEIRRAQSLKRAKDGKPKEFLRVETINEKMAALTRDVMAAQKPMIDLVGRLDEIRGLLIDFYDWKPEKKK